MNQEGADSDPLPPSERQLGTQVDPCLDTADPREAQSGSEDRRLRRSLLVVVIFAAATASVLLWWFDPPSPPTASLDIATSTRPATTSGAAQDPEQQAFLERHDKPPIVAPRQEEDTPGGVTLTDRQLVRLLSGQWLLDLGRHEVRADFVPVVVDRVRRGSLLVELYPVSADGLPPFFTPFHLPGQGSFLAFCAADGKYRLVLEDLRIHGPELLSYLIGDSTRRLTARRLSGRRLGGGPPSGEDATASSARDPETAETDPPPIERTAPRGEPVEIVVAPPPPAPELWRHAQELREQERFHTLKAHLGRMARLYPTHSGTRRWRRRVDGWIRDQEKDLTKQVMSRLEELTEAIEDRDPDDVFEQWDDRPDTATRQFFKRLFARHERLKARASTRSVTVIDGTAEFRTTVTIEGSDRDRRGVEIDAHPWHGQLRDGHFVSPFG